MLRALAAITASSALTLSMFAGALTSEPAPTEVPRPGAESVPTPQMQADITDHGVANSSINLTGRSVIDTWDDGTNVSYLFNSGHPVTLNVLDMDTHEVLDRQELSDYSSFAAQVLNEEDGMLYFSVRSPNDGSLFRYDPAAQEVTQLATDVVGEEMLRSLIVLDGVIYGSTFPNAKVFSYDIATGEIHDYGTVEESSTYAWGFEEVDGNLWVGTGTTPRLREVDPQTGEITDIELPSHMTGEDKQYIHDIIRRDDLVFIRSSPSGSQNLAIYDLEADDWCCTDTELMGTWTLDSYDDKFYYIVGTEVRGYDLQTREDFSIGWNESNLAGEQSGSGGMRLVELDDPDYPGETLMGIRSDGILWHYNLQNQTGQMTELPIQGAPATTQSIGVGPDGNVYVGAHLSAGLMGRVLHDTGEVEHLEGPQQGDEIATVSDQLVVGTYQDAGFHAGDMTQDWEWGTNPQHLFSIGPDADQERVTDIIEAGDLAAAGTVPGRNTLGGTMVLFDVAGGEPEVHRHIVPDHTVTTLAYQDGLIYGGTSVHGGHGEDPADGSAQLFIWDIEAQERLDSIVIEEGSQIIHSLTFDDTGQLWGMTNTGTVFEFDPDSHQIETTVETGLAHSNQWGWNATMTFSPHDGLIYGNAGSTMFTVDPEHGDYTVIEGPEGVRHSAVHEDGTVYFTDTTNVYSFTPEAAGATCDETITGTHTGQLVIDGGMVCIEQATVTGGIELGAEASMVLTDSSVRGPITATGAEQIQITGSDLRGPLRIEQAAADVRISENEIRGPVSVNHLTAPDPAVISGNLIRGPLQCHGSATDPVNEDAANTIHGRAAGQCAGL